ncbi:hypothetical protein ACE1CD_10630 [Aerosakkonema sp. BLCC-F183]|uniref:hypothetical protein n=1 Tax=Aerosakkonema sp. BLCC-F183 TaxID=3342834 RepID=UPI0035B74E74
MTVNQSRIKIDSSVLPGLDVLSEEERANVLKSIDSLENFSIDRPLASNIKKLNEEEQLYLLQVDASLRIIFDVTSEDRIEILELFRRKTIEYMFRKKAQ